MKFIRFSPSQHSGDIHVRTDAVVAVSPDSIHGLMKAPSEIGSVIHVYGNGLVYVKESPAQVIEALRASEPTGTVSIEIVVPDGDTSSLMDDCACHCGECCDDEPDAADYALALKEAHDDAKIADERAEWYGKVAEGAIADRDKALRDAAYYKQIADSRLDVLGHKQTELDRYAAEIGTEIAKSANLRNERDQLLAKLKDTTAALDKANAELNAARYDKFWHLRKGGLNDYIGNTTAPDPNQKAY